MTVVNLGDSRVVLGYVKEMHSNSPLSVRASSYSTAGTTPEDDSSSSVKSYSKKNVHHEQCRTFNSPKHVQLSTDHKPDVPEEKYRILKSGSLVGNLNLRAEAEKLSISLFFSLFFSLSFFSLSLLSPCLSLSLPLFFLSLSLSLFHYLFPHSIFLH